MEQNDIDKRLQELIYRYKYLQAVESMNERTLQRLTWQKQPAKHKGKCLIIDVKKPQ